MLSLYRWHGWIYFALALEMSRGKYREAGGVKPLEVLVVEMR